MLLIIKIIMLLIFSRLKMLGTLHIGFLGNDTISLLPKTGRLVVAFNMFYCLPIREVRYSHQTGCTKQDLVVDEDKWRIFLQRVSNSLTLINISANLPPYIEGNRVAI